MGLTDLAIADFTTVLELDCTNNNNSEGGNGNGDGIEIHPSAPPTSSSYVSNPSGLSTMTDQGEVYQGNSVREPFTPQVRNNSNHISYGNNYNTSHLNSPPPASPFISYPPVIRITENSLPDEPNTTNPPIVKMTPVIPVGSQVKRRVPPPPPIRPNHAISTNNSLSNNNKY